ncbi:hypothetical protein C8R46DRAFT_1054954 [Mycena filopes]|nr:hypothetical protein C8R46DRAFT_1054954 [Mycena filopes]
MSLHWNWKVLRRANEAVIVRICISTQIPQVDYNLPQRLPPQLWTMPITTANASPALWCVMNLDCNALPFSLIVLSRALRPDDCVRCSPVHIVSPHEGTSSRRTRKHRKVSYPLGSSVTCTDTPFNALTSRSPAACVVHGRGEFRYRVYP